MTESDKAPASGPSATTTAGAKGATAAVREGQAPRQLPSQEEIAAWIEGADLPTLPALFDRLPLARFDALVMQIRKEELLPQHWQVISQRSIDETTFEELGEVRRLRSRYGDEERADVRLANLKAAWRELGGKQPSLWTVADLFAALRRIIARRLEVDYHELLSALRDVWAGLTLPHGREQREILWACLALIREKTKK